MNTLRGAIVSVETSGHVSLVEVDVKGDVFSALVLETVQTAPYLHDGNEITILFKETEVAISKGMPGAISIRNIFTCRISGIDVGEILSDIELDCKGTSVHSIITTKSVKKLDLHVGDEVVGLVKSNEIMLKP